MNGEKLTGLFKKFGDKDSLLVPLLALAPTLIVAAVICIVVKSFLLASFFGLCTLGVGVLVIHGRWLYSRQLQKDIEDIIYQDLKKRGLKLFSVASITEGYDIPYEKLRRACIEIYRRFARDALRDFVITENERKVLALLAQKLMIPVEMADELEQETKGEAYNQEFQRRLSDGILTTKQTQELQEIRRILGLSDRTVREATQQSALERYKGLFNRFAATGVINPSELEQLKKTETTTGMSPAEAANISPGEAINLYRRTIAMVCQDGIITDDEDRMISAIENILKLPQKVITSYREQYNELKQIGTIRKGDLPIVRNRDLHLKSTEICHWYGGCIYSYETRTRVVELSGKLIVSNRRVVFLSSQRGLEFPIKRIANIRLKSDAVILSLSVSRGQGVYYVKNPQILVAILEALIRKHNYVLAEKLDNARRRQIPDEVKEDVWQRDGGRCVKCGATDYLEFDHVIPFSQGGANSEKNVQLLCRRCNLAKGGELV